MFKDSTELLEHAIRELRIAIKENKKDIEILLKKDFPDNQRKVNKFCDKFELKVMTEFLREEFLDYIIKSEVCTKSKLKSVITLKKAPCILLHSYSLVWKLSFQRK